MGSRRTYSAEFKREAVELSNRSGVSVAQVAQDLGIQPNMLTRWRRELRTTGPKAFRGQGVARDEELARLRRVTGCWAARRSVKRWSCRVSAVVRTGSPG